MNKFIEVRLVLKDYKKQRDDMMELIKNDIIDVISNTEKGWSMGKNRRTNLQGWFPIAFTQLKEDDDDEYYYYSDDESELVKANKKPIKPVKPTRPTKQQVQEKVNAPSKDDIQSKIDHSIAVQLKLQKELDILSQTQTIDLPFDLNEEQSKFVIQEENQILKSDINTLNQEMEMNEMALQSLQEEVQQHALENKTDFSTINKENLDILLQILSQQKQLHQQQGQISGYNLVDDTYLAFTSQSKLKKGLEKELKILEFLKDHDDIQKFLAESV